MYYKLAPLILVADFYNLGLEMSTVAQAGVEYIHLGVMDGTFVLSISFGMSMLKSLCPCTEAVFDVHMMVEDPGRYVADMKACGADIIMAHTEACTHPDQAMNQTREQECRVGAALNPATPIHVLDRVLDQLDMVLITTVDSGFGGQKFIPYTLNKVRSLRERINRLGLKADVQVDGGISAASVRGITEAGANVFMAGSAMLGRDAAAKTKEFIEIFRGYES